MSLDFICGALFTLALLCAALGGFFVRGRWTRRDADRPLEEPDEEAEPVRSVPARPEPQDEETRRRRERARAEQEAFQQVMRYNENAAYGIEPLPNAARR